MVEILRGVGDQLKEDEKVAPFILEPLDYQGVDTLDDTGVVLLMRIRTVPGKHLLVGRAFNRLVKIAFDEHRVAGRDPAAAVMISGSSIDEPADEPRIPVTRRHRA